MGMSSYSRRRSREEYKKWLAWYETLSPEEQRREDERIEWMQLKAVLYTLLFCGGIFVMAVISNWINGK